MKYRLSIRQTFSGYNQFLLILIISDEELPTDEKTFIDNPMEDKKEKSDDDDLYEF